jgi:class 3 adenylate cyclase/tetratricopeptide (TPR) repeat protein
MDKPKGQAALCPSCGFANPEEFAFCGKCGARVADVSVPPRQGTPVYASPQSYTPRHLVEKILISKSALEGERKHVTVLFADLKGSMELLADRDPEEARKLLDPVLERMMEAVHRYEGTVNQVMGDGIMALFGAPLAHEDHAVRACYAALDMQAAIYSHAEKVRRIHGVVLQIRVGLNSGEVVVRAIGSDLRMDYTAVGQTTHLAARMEQLAKPDTTLLTADVLRLAEGFISVVPLGAVPVKGLTAPIEVYELTGTGPLRSRLHAAVARGLTRFVGREHELQQLYQAIGGAASGHGQVLALVGEAGVGKSRLVWEAAHSHRIHGWLILETGSLSYRQATPYLPVLDLLKGYFKIQGRDDSREIRQKVIGKLLALDEVLQPTLPALFTLLDVPVEDPQWRVLEPLQRRQRTLEAVTRLLLRESEVQPLLLVFEDLHWIDTETQALLDGLVECLPTARVLLLVNYRPEYQHRWGSKASYTQLHLEPLSPQNAEELFHVLLGDDPGLGLFRQPLIDRTEGNPFFMEECVRALVETGLLVGEPGRYRLEGSFNTGLVPATVQAVLAARIDRLSPEEKRLLQCAAVVGKNVPLSLLRAIAGLDDEALRRYLDSLQAAEFLYEVRLLPDPEHTFKHTLTHEVVYGSLLHDRRITLHRRIVEALERLPAGRTVEQLELLAHHAYLGEVWEKAVDYVRQVGLIAASRSAHREAVTRFQQALEALAHLPVNRGTIEHGIDIRLDLRNSLHPLGHLEQILDHLHVAEAQARSLKDQRRLVHISAFMCQYFRLMGNLDSAIHMGERAVAIAGETGDPLLQIVANSGLGPACGASGDYRRAAQLLAGTVERFQGSLSSESLGTTGLLSVFCRIYLVCCLAELGEFRRAASYADEAIGLAEGAAHVYSLTFACYGAGTLCLLQGEIERSISLLERGLELSSVPTLPLVFPLLASSLGEAYALSGRPGEAISLLEEADRQAVSMQRMGGQPMLLVRLGDAYFRAGRLDEAIPCASRALKLARVQKERGHEAHALRLYAEIASSEDSRGLADGETIYLQAITLAEELGMQPLRARCLLGLGQRHRRAGRYSHAEEFLTRALASFRTLNMPFWLEAAEAELNRLG